jgi:hypothetical protein
MKRPSNLAMTVGVALTYSAYRSGSVTSTNAIMYAAIARLLHEVANLIAALWCG